MLLKINYSYVHNISWLNNSAWFIVNIVTIQYIFKRYSNSYNFEKRIVYTGCFKSFHSITNWNSSATVYRRLMNNVDKFGIVMTVDWA